MSNVRAMLMADAVEMGHPESYVKFIVGEFDKGLLDYDPDTKEVFLTQKGLEEGYSLRSAKSLN